MKYSSTRSEPTPDSCVDFKDAVLNGLAADGGLYYPLTIPKLTPEQLNNWRNLSYTELVIELLSIFSNGKIPRSDLDHMAQRAAKKFALKDWTQLKRINSNYVLELFHGPSFSFKDYAMCILGELMTYLLVDDPNKRHLLVATSGDTGSAAIYGFKESAKITCHVLFPHGRISDIQRRQMTTTNSPSVNCYAVKGDFDDCQRLLKEAFADPNLRESARLLAVNSVNFARIVCQMVYYFWTVYRIQDQEGNPQLECDFVVPTGNFGNILAGYYAKLMGSKIRRLIIASNVNDILPRAYKSGRYELSQVVPTMSPAIDIQVSSNFERLLQHLNQRPVGDLFKQLKQDGHFDIEKTSLDQLRNDFRAFRSTEEDVRDACTSMFSEYNYLIDTHTAVAYSAAQKYLASEELKGCRLVIVSTAHPAKFAEDLKTIVPENIVEKSIPTQLNLIKSAPERFKIIEPKLDCLEPALKADS